MGGPEGRRGRERVERVVGWWLGVLIVCLGGKERESDGDVDGRGRSDRGACGR